MKHFFELIKKTSKQFKSSLVAILIGAAVFAALLLIVQGVFEAQAERIVRTEFFSMGISEERFEELQDRMRQGDASAFDELLLEMSSVAEGADAMDEEARSAFVEKQGFLVAMALLPVSLLFLVLSCLVWILSSTYFFMLGTHKTKDPLVAIRHALGKFIPMVGLWFWIAARSLVWIPIVGVFTGLYYLPRFVFSPVILLESKQGVFASVRESTERTKGAWLTVVGNFLGLMLCAWIAWMAIVFLASRTGDLSRIVTAVGVQLVIAFMVVFTAIFADRYLKQRTKR